MQITINHYSSLVIARIIVHLYVQNKQYWYLEGPNFEPILADAKTKQARRRESVLGGVLASERDRLTSPEMTAEYSHVICAIS